MEKNNKQEIDISNLQLGTASDLLGQKLVEYNQEALNMKTPLARELYKLFRSTPNDQEFGKKVRSLVQFMVDNHEMEIKKETEDSLKRILEENRNNDNLI